MPPARRTLGFTGALLLQIAFTGAAQAGDAHYEHGEDQKQHDTNFDRPSNDEQTSIDAHAALVLSHGMEQRGDDSQAHERHTPHAHLERDVYAVLGGHHHGADSGYQVSLALLVADYDAQIFTGDYQGLIARARWTRGSFGFTASVPMYRLEKNGKTVEGVGDLMVHGHRSLVEEGAWALGAMMMLSAPTGNGTAGLGMGHVMVMPEVWSRWTRDRIAIAASLGYARSLGSRSSHAEHGGGMWPLVDPMNASEATSGASATFALNHSFGLGTRWSGAIPLGDGTIRLIGGVQLRWVAGRVETSVELQHGVVGDPFGLRGIVETAINFH